MKINEKINKYLSEGTTAKNIALNTVISEIVPSNIRNPSKYVEVIDFYGDEKYWVIMVKFRDTYYAMEGGTSSHGLNQMWEGRTKGKVSSHIKRDTGIDFSK